MTARYTLKGATGKALLCEVCGRGVAAHAPRQADIAPDCCVSCGMMMDQKIYFTICPHCGFNYRIEVSPMRHSDGLKRRTEVLLYATSILVPFSGFAIGASYIKETDLPSRRAAMGYVALGALNLIVSSFLALAWLRLT